MKKSALGLKTKFAPRNSIPLKSNGSTEFGRIQNIFDKQRIHGAIPVGSKRNLQVYLEDLRASNQDARAGLVRAVQSDKIDFKFFGNTWKIGLPILVRFSSCFYPSVILRAYGRSYFPNNISIATDSHHSIDSQYHVVLSCSQCHIGRS